MTTLNTTNTTAGHGDSLFSAAPDSPMSQPVRGAARYHRTSVRGIASIRFAEEEFVGQVMNLSVNGCLLKTDASLELGTPIDLRVTLYHGNRRSVADVRGVVRRRAEVEGGPGYGVELLGESPLERRSLGWLYGQALG